MDLLALIPYILRRYLCQIYLCGLSNCILPNRLIHPPVFFLFMDGKAIADFHSTARSSNIFHRNHSSELARSIVNKNITQKNLFIRRQQIHPQIASS